MFGGQRWLRSSTNAGASAAADSAQAPSAEHDARNSSSPPERHVQYTSQLEGGSDGMQKTEQPQRPDPLPTAPRATLVPLEGNTLQTTARKATKNASRLPSDDISPPASSSPGSGESSATASGHGVSSGTIAAGSRQLPSHAVPTTPSGPQSNTSRVPASAPPAPGAVSQQLSPLFDVPAGYRTVISSQQRQASLHPSADAAAAHEQLQQKLDLGPSTSSTSASSSALSPPFPLQATPTSAYHDQEIPFSRSQTVSGFAQAPYSPRFTSQQAQTAQHYFPHPPSAGPSTRFNDLQVPPPAFLRSVVQPTPSSSASMAQAHVQHLQDAAEPSGSQITHDSAVPRSSSSSSTASTTGSGRTTRHTKRQSYNPGDMTVDTQVMSSTPAFQSHHIASAPASTTQFGYSEQQLQQAQQAQNLQWSTSSSTLAKSTASDAARARNAHLSWLQTHGHPPSTPHSRSPSVSSASLSTLGPLSASTSSSASSSVGESFLHFGTAPRKSARLSNLQRKALCQYADGNPRVKHEHIGSMFGIERSTVSKILKQKTKWLQVTDDNHVPLSPKRDSQSGRHRIGRHPELEEALIEWGREQTRNGASLTDDIVRTKALEIAELQKIDRSAFKASAGWLENFKDRSGYRNGKFSLDAILPMHFREGSDELLEGEGDEEDRQHSISRTPSEQNIQPPGRSASNSVSSASVSTTSGVLGTTHSSSGSTGNETPALVSSHAPTSSVSSIQQSAGWRSLSSLHSSSASLPGLAEEEELCASGLPATAGSTTASSRSSSRHGSSAFSFTPYTTVSGARSAAHVQHSHAVAMLEQQQSPFPSPTYSDAPPPFPHGPAYDSNAPAHLRDTPSLGQMSTPTQRTVYNAAPTPHFTPTSTHGQVLLGTPAYISAEHSDHIQQAGIDFNLSLQTSPVKDYYSPQIQMSNEHLSSHEDGHAFASPRQPGPHLYAGMAYGSPAHHGHTRMISTPVQHLPSPVSTVAASSRLRQATHPMALHQPVSASHLWDSNDGHSRVPLVRSHTDPMPLWQQSSMTDETSAGDLTMTANDGHDQRFDAIASATSMGMYDSMQVDGMHESLPLHYQPVSHDHAFQPGSSHGRTQSMQQVVTFANDLGPSHAPHARRATVSSLGSSMGDKGIAFTDGHGGLTYSSSSSSLGGHGHSYSMSAVTTPVYAQFGNDVHVNSGVTFEDAYDSLKRAVDFLQCQPNRTQLAGPDQFSTLETVLHQFRAARVMQASTLTPPSST